MIEVIYKTLLIFCWSVMLFMGFYLIFGGIVEELVSSAYERSRKLIGLGFVIFGLEYVVFSIFNLRLEDPSKAIAFNLCVLSIVGNLFALAIFSLLDSEVNLSFKNIIVKVLSVVLFVTVILCTVLFCHQPVINMVLFIGLALYLLQLLFWTVTLHDIYKHAKIRAEDYYSECIEQSIEWLPRTMYHLVGLCFACSIAAFAPLWIIIIYLLYAILVFYYIFNSLLNMTIDRSIVGFFIASNLCCDVRANDETVVTGDLEESTILRPDVVAYIDQQLVSWVDSKEYLNGDITIKSLALIMNTNRTYLSNYINSKYKCSFRDWITDLRLSEAKRLMLVEDDISMAKLSSRVGFTSSASFSRSFARVEGVPPNRWRDINIVD